MGFAEDLRSLSIRVPGILDYTQNEAHTRSALVNPFLQALGYNTSDLREVVPEFGANVNAPGVTQNKKVDYAILQDGKPQILVEVKHHRTRLDSGYASLAAYFAAAAGTEVGILTNGVVYRVYTDIERENLLDRRPFLTINMAQLSEESLADLAFLTRDGFDVDRLKERAQDLRYIKGIKSLLKEQYDSPSDDFVKFFFRELCPHNSFVGNLKQAFVETYVPTALQEFLREEIDALFDEVREMREIASLPEPSTPETETAVDTAREEESSIETTEEEWQGYAIIKSLLNGKVDLDRVAIRDCISYCGILLDNNNSKPLCRLHFNTRNKRISLFDREGSTAADREDKIEIGSINDLYQYGDRLAATLAAYDAGQ